VYAPRASTDAQPGAMTRQTSGARQSQKHICKQSAHIPPASLRSRARSAIVGASLEGKCITMATLKPRITVTLEPEVYSTIKGLAEAQSLSMSALVSEFLTMVNPVQQRVLKAIKKAQDLDAKSKSNMVTSLELGEAQLTQMLGPLMDLFDQMAESQPPHSNTGVTNTNSSEKNKPEKPSKALSRASEPVEKSTKEQKHKNTKKQAPAGASNAA
jgi:predicted DNA-binding ribbon-helix-helix protein